jgi:hypothetical protein
MPESNYLHLGNTDDHISNVRRDSGNTGLLLSLGEPHLELEAVLGLLSSSCLDIEGKMSEGSLKSSSGTLDGDFSGLVSYSNYGLLENEDIFSTSFGNINFFLSENCFH